MNQPHRDNFFDQLNDIENYLEIYIDNDDVSGIQVKDPECLLPLGEIVTSSCCENLASLNLMNFGLQRVLEWVFALSQLKKLNLARNQLSNISEKRGLLKCLEWIFIRENKLGTLPESLSLCVNLKHITAWRNDLKSLPESIGC